MKTTSSFSFVLAFLCLSAVGHSATDPGIAVETIPAPTGHVIAWGGNGDRQATVPAAAKADVISVAASGNHTLALKSNGSVVAWGSNSNGQTTVPVAAQSGVIAISAGFTHNLALKSNGSVVAWGSNEVGEATVPVAAQSGVTAIAACYNHSLALKSDGSVVRWGTNPPQDLFGDPTPSMNIPVAAQSGVTAIAGGFLSGFALKGDGSVVAWGNYRFFFSSAMITVPVEAQSGVIAIAANAFNAMALKSDGSVITWGVTSIPAPEEAQSGVAAISAGYSHDLALKNGGVVAWGNDESGQSTVPVVAQSAVTAIAGGESHTVVVRLCYNFAPQVVGAVGPEQIITIRNDGTAPLDIASVSLTGGNPGDFVLNTTGMSTSVPAGGQTTVTLAFAPQETGSTDYRAANVQISSNALGESIYVFPVDGLAFSYTDDSDSDGLNDAAEVLRPALGFDWEVPQAQLAGAYNGGRTEGIATGENNILNDPNAHDLYTTPQIQALNIGTPLLQQIAPGQFKLTLGIEKSATLLPGSFAPFPFTAPETSVNGEGKLEFLFTAPGDAAFFRLQAQ